MARSYSTVSRFARVLLCVLGLALLGGVAVPDAQTPPYTVNPPTDTPEWRDPYPADWDDYRPKEPLRVGAIYRHPYTWVMHVLAKQTLLDGTEVYIVHELQGNTVCHQVKTHVCGIPGTTLRGSWVPVKTDQMLFGTP